MFQSTLPARGATVRAAAVLPRGKSFNPRSPHGERRTPAARSSRGTCFNPRSPHGERRAGVSAALHSGHSFNPRSPHGERRTKSCIVRELGGFNPRSPHGERRRRYGAAVARAHVSIHAPRTGSDKMRHTSAARLHLFQSTLPARGATVGTMLSGTTSVFQSTLPARGATGTQGRTRRTSCRFNPRSPHGERRQRSLPRAEGSIVSIHAPRTGSDTPYVCGPRELEGFNPRSPHGERLFCHVVSLPV